MEFSHHLDQVGGRSAAEPVGVELCVGEGPEEAERVVDVG